MTIKQNLENAKIGDTIIQPWQFVSSTDETPIPQAGKRYTFTLKLNATDADQDAEVYVDHTVPAGTDADNGIISIRVESSVTELLKQTSYNYELKEIITAAPEDTIITLFDGKLKMEH